jgi:2-oxoglutarate dehydrogenase complex dehydrogenase (E1) component-like enzyme
MVPAMRPFSTKIDSFMSGSNSVYVEQMYDSWLQDPKRYACQGLDSFIAVLSMPWGV